jgi:tape measure domain-containing protein
MIAGTIEIQMLADLARIKKDMDEARGVVEGATGKMTRAIDFLKGALATIGAAALLKELADMTDRFKSLEGRMILATGSADAATKQIDALTGAANRQKVPLEEVLKLYLGAERAANDLGATTTQLTKFTEGISAGLRLSGSSAQAASGSLIQLTQLLGGTNVQAQEFNSLIDGMPEVLRTVAANLGTTGISMGELREMVVKGRLSSAEFFQAFLKGSDDLIAKAATLPPTVGGAFTVVSNNILLAVGRIDKEIGASGAFAKAVQAFGDSIPALIEPVLKLTAAIEPAIKIAAAYFAVFVAAPAIITALITAKVAATAALVSFTAAASLVGAPIAAFTLLMGGATTASFALAGSIGTLQLALGVLFAAFAGFQIGSYLRENFQAAALAGIAFVEGTLLGWEAVRYGAQVAWAYIANAWEVSLSGMGGVLSGFLRNMAGGLSSLGLDSAAEKVLGWATRITDATRSTGDLDARLAALRGEYDRSTGAVRSITGAMADDTIAKFTNAKQTASTTAEITKITTATTTSAAATKAKADAEKAAAAEAKKADDAYNKLRIAIMDKTGAMLAEDQAGVKLTAGQTYALGVMQDIQNGTLRLTDARKREITALLEQYLATEQVNATRREEADLQRLIAADKVDIVNQLRGQTGELEKLLEKQRAENEILRVGEGVLKASEAARLRETAAQKEAIATTSDQSDELLRQAGLLRARADALDEGVALKEAKAAADEWKKTTDQIERGLTDSLFRAFESGGKFFSTLWDGIKNTIKTTVLRIVVDAAVNWIKDAGGTLLNSILGGSGSDGLGGFFGDLKSSMGGWFGSLTNSMGGWLGSLGNSLGGMIGSLGSALGGALGGIGNFVGSLFGGGGGGVGSAIGGGLSAAGSFLGVSGSGFLGSVGGALSAVAPWALGAGAVLAIANKIFGGGGGPKVSGLANTAGAAGLRGGAVQSGVADQQAAQILGSVQQQYQQLAQSLGGTAGQFTGTAFFAQDPKGKAATQLILDAAVNGQLVFSRNNNLQTGANIEDVGRSNEAFAEAVAQAQTQALLASLKATTFSDANIAQQVAAINSNASWQDIAQQLQAIAAARAQQQAPAQAANDPYFNAMSGAGASGLVDLNARIAAATERTAISANEVHGWLAYLGPVQDNILHKNQQQHDWLEYLSSQAATQVDKLQNVTRWTNHSADWLQQIYIQMGGLRDDLKREMHELRVQVYNSEQVLLVPARDTADALNGSARGQNPLLTRAAA